MDNEAGIVLSAIFDASRRNETIVKMEKTGMTASFLGKLQRIVCQK